MAKTHQNWIIAALLIIGALGVLMAVQYILSRDLPEHEVVVASPVAGERVTSPLTIEGMAHSNWYVDGVFPVEVQDVNGMVLGQGQASKQSGAVADKDGYIPFSATLTFAATSGQAGALVLRRSNPNDKYRFYRTEVPVTF